MNTYVPSLSGCKSHRWKHDSRHELRSPNDDLQRNFVSFCSLKLAQSWILYFIEIWGHRIKPNSKRYTNTDWWFYQISYMLTMGSCAWTKCEEGRNNAAHYPCVMAQDDSSEQVNAMNSGLASCHKSFNSVFYLDYWTSKSLHYTWWCHHGLCHDATMAYVMLQFIFYLFVQEVPQGLENRERYE